MEKNRLNIMSLKGNITQVRVRSKLDTSKLVRQHVALNGKLKRYRRNSRSYSMNTTINPESVKDISACTM